METKIIREIEYNFPDSMHLLARMLAHFHIAQCKKQEVDFIGKDKLEGKESAKESSVDNNGNFPTIDKRSTCS